MSLSINSILCYFRVSFNELIFLLTLSCMYLLLCMPGNVFPLWTKTLLSTVDPPLTETQTIDTQLFVSCLKVPVASEFQLLELRVTVCLRLSGPFPWVLVN